MRRPLLLAAALIVLVPAAPSEAAKAKPPKSWADAEIRLVVARGFAADAAAFRPDDNITRAELAELLETLTGTEQAPVANPAVRLDMAGLNALRKNHPAKQDALERLPADPASRAEAAYSAAQILRFGGWETERVEDAAAAFALPPLTEWQRRILATGFKLVGYPYVWGGTSDITQTVFGATVPGGYDCSGFVWRVYKLQAYPNAGTLASTLGGRTTYTMSAEVPKARRLPFAALQPADVVFFGSKGPRSKPAEVGHMGIYVGNGWFVHSSRHGVALETLTGWYRDSFAWARRPLAEAGLASRPRA